jgi:hypothetical protein
MAITFESVKDPYGLGAAGNAIGQASIQSAMMNRQKNQETEERKKRGGALELALADASKPNATFQDKIGAFQKYAAQTGDTQSVAPFLKQLLSEASKQDESQAALDFLRNQGQEIPESKPGQKLPSSGFLGQYAKSLKSEYEPESEKIEAKRTADVADRVVSDYEGAEASKNRLIGMRAAAKSGQLPTPAMVKTLDFLGVPLGVLSNPLAEGYEKSLNDYIKDVGKYFPGTIRVAEIEAYMKSIPSLLNSDAGKEIVIENTQLINDLKEANYEAYKDILKENGGKKPQNLDIEILEKTREKRNETSDKVKQNFERAISMTKFPTQKVKKGTPLTPNIALKYLGRAGNDRKEAEKLAREDGYEF